MATRSFIELLHRDTDPRALALFRILFGALLFYEMGYYLETRLVEVGIVGPKLLFPYPGFEWLRPLGVAGMRGLLIAMAGACVLVTIGAFYRIAIVFFFLGFTYIMLLDKAYYNNHLYLFSLLAFLMIWLPANRAWSVDRKLFGSKIKVDIPYWSWLVLRLQIVIVYFYGGIAKLNPDWLLRGEPMRTMLGVYSQNSSVADLWTSDITLYGLLYGGLIFDLAIGPLLWWKRTRKYALPFVLLFNITNHLMFDDIGIFPFFMIAATILFFDPSEIVAFLGLDKKQKKKKRNAVDTPMIVPTASSRTLIHAGLAGYFIFQLLFPLRWLVLPGNTDWTSIGQRFSWRMKITTRMPLLITYNVVDTSTNTVHPVQVQEFINNYQAGLCSMDPRASVRFAQYLREEAGRRGMPNVKITSRIVISYNGRPYRYLWPPDQDLSRVDPYPSQPDAWIPPLDAPELELSQQELNALRNRRS